MCLKFYSIDRYVCRIGLSCGEASCYNEASWEGETDRAQYNTASSLPRDSSCLHEETFQESCKAHPTKHW